MLKYYIILIFLELFLCAPNCKEGQNFCASCNPITKLCIIMHKMPKRCIYSR